MSRNLMLIMLPLVLLAGCQDKQRGKIVGTWEIEQADKLTRRLKTEDDSANETTPAESRMKVEFQNSGKLITTTLVGNINRTKEGTWSLTSLDEKTGLAKIECTIGMQQTEHEVSFVDDDTIKMVPPNMAGLSMKLKFKRSK